MMLCEAVLAGNEKNVNKYLLKGADPNLEVISRGLPLDIIVKQNDLSDVKLYLENNWYLCSYLLECPNIPLYTAIAMRNHRIVELLLKYGAKASVLGTEVNKNTPHFPPIIFALLFMNYNVVKALLPAIDNVDEKWGKNNETPLMTALKLEDTKVAKLLIEKGFNWAAANGEIKVLKQLMKHILYLSSYDKNININPAIISLVKGKESELGQLFCSNYQANIIEPANSQHNLH